MLKRQSNKKVCARTHFARERCRKANFSTASRASLGEFLFNRKFRRNFLLNKKIFVKLAAVLLALLFWQILAFVVDEELIVPSAADVCKRVFSLIGEEDFISTVLFSVTRIFTGTLIGVAAGIVLGIIAGKYEPVKIILEPYFVTAKTVPVASLIIILLVWLSSRELPIFVSGLVVFPIIYSNTLTGFRETDNKLLEMAKTFKLGTVKKLRFIYIPAVYPYFISALTTATGNAWKAGIAAEIIGLPDGSIGNNLYKSKIYFETADMFAWTIVIVCLSFVFEKAIIGVVKLGFNRMK